MSIDTRLRLMIISDNGPFVNFFPIRKVQNFFIGFGYPQASDSERNFFHLDKPGNTNNVLDQSGELCSLRNIFADNL